MAKKKKVFNFRSKNKYRAKLNQLMKKGEPVLGLILDGPRYGWKYKIMRYNAEGSIEVKDVSKKTFKIKAYTGGLNGKN